MLVAGAYMAWGDAAGARALGWATWVWIAILLVVLLVSFVVVSPASPETTGEPPP